jgi:transcription termination factor Rho
MILGFITKIKDKPTFFPEKILSCMHYDLKIGAKLNEFLNFERLGYKTKQDLINKILSVKPKKHTIRRDEKQRWKFDNWIHFNINVRTVLMYLFAPIIKCKSTQIIEIGKLKSTDIWYLDFAVSVDDVYLSASQIEKLAINDGFDSVEDFFEWFNEDYKGKIIHWTDLKY